MYLLVSNPYGLFVLVYLSLTREEDSSCLSLIGNNISIKEEQVNRF